MLLNESSSLNTQARSIVFRIIVVKKFCIETLY